MKIECQHCHNLVEPIIRKVTFGDFIVCLFLCVLWVIPGVVYIAIKAKEAGKICPNCKMKIG